MIKQLMISNPQSSIPHPREVTAIIVTYESAGVIARCLESLQAQHVGAIVVDNASTDESAAIAKAHGATLLLNDKNIGFGRAMNQGVRAATTPYCLLINPDATVEEGCIATLLNAAKSHWEAVILAPEIREPDGRIFFHEHSLLNTSLRKEKVGGGACSEESSPPNPPPAGEGMRAVGFVSGACMLIRRDWFLNAGGFDEHIFLFYEDDDLCRRAHDSGKQVLYVPEAKMLHLRGKSVAPSAAHAYSVRYHLAFSRMYISKKYGLKTHAAKLMALSAAKLIFAVCICNKRKIIRHWAYLRGLIAGNKK